MHELHHLVHLYGYPVITAAIALECAGLLIPAETLFFTTAVYASTTGQLSVAAVIVAAALGAIVGSIAGFWIGRLLGSRVISRHGARVGLNHRRLALMHYLFAKHGGKVVFFGRFVTGLRSFTPLLAGASFMRWPVFLVWAVAGGIVWPLAHGLLAAALGRAAREVSAQLGIAIGVIAVVAVGVAIYFVKRNETRLTEAALRWEQHERA